MSYNGTPLTRRETELVAGWERERKGWITLGELRERLGEETRATVRDLKQHGLLESIAPGRYLIHPFRSLGRPRAVSATIVAAALLADEPYYLGGGWAFWFHRLTQQVFGFRLDAYVRKQRRHRQLHAARLVFHVLPEDAFSYGIETVVLEDAAVSISDAARTVLDALDYPATFGDLRAALHFVEPALERVDRTRLVSHAVRGSHPSTCQRLGVLLERRGASQRSLAPLERRIRETSSLLSMLPDAPRTGRVNTRWQVVENDLRPSSHLGDQGTERA